MFIRYMSTFKKSLVVNHQLNKITKYDVKSKRGIVMVLNFASKYA